MRSPSLQAALVQREAIEKLAITWSMEGRIIHGLQGGPDAMDPISRAVRVYRPADYDREMLLHVRAWFVSGLEFHLVVRSDARTSLWTARKMRHGARGWYASRDMNESPLIISTETVTMASVVGEAEIEGRE